MIESKRMRGLLYSETCRIYGLLVSATVGPGMRQGLPGGNLAVRVQLRPDGWLARLHDDSGSIRSQAGLPRLPVRDARCWRRRRVLAQLHLLRRVSLRPRSRARGEHRL